jgi:transcription elongation GreA/GreB family factor
MTFKQKVYTASCDVLKEKISSLRNSLLELEEGSESDTKSSVGDKHETARAMMQIEQEKLSKQLNDALEQELDLQKINLTLFSDQIKKGSLVTTNKGVLFISAALGKITVDEKAVMVLSSLSPLGKKLMGLKINNSTEINGAEYIVERIE